MRSLEARKFTGAAPANGRGASEATEDYDKDDQELIDEITKLDATTWSKISYWGTKTQRLNQIERGVAHTLSEYASGN